MITIDGATLQFSNMGYFIGENDWIHPDRIIDTYELIFVTGGEVFICEDQTQYALKRGDALVLRPHVRHAGYQKSDGACFFWLHFQAENYENVGERFFHANDCHNYELLFRRLNHLASIHANPSLIECELALMLLKRKYDQNKGDKIFSEIADYIRIHISEGITVTEVAKKVGFHPDHLSKIFIKHTGISLKKYIDNERNAFVKSKLLNTALTVKEIAYSSGFPDDGALIKFFRYHNRQTPTEFRSLYYATHTNNQ